jgi:hypothetical protein
MIQTHLVPWNERPCQEDVHPRYNIQQQLLTRKASRNTPSPSNSQERLQIDAQAAANGQATTQHCCPGDEATQGQVDSLKLLVAAPDGAHQDDLPA